ncbi:hypothetical protein S2091_3608 [Solimicrobium silvestre]|uniref:Uncharacterized protein n=2 Tax=Solimicrobium silvestre TaxID=2099400 RepID=A0A2S9GVD7_9BURK|nr:hypothetical protein S2091_3608 [Solimicrobium silvestre]
MKLVNKIKHVCAKKMAQIDGRQLVILFLYVFVLGFFFAKVEIQIEGPDGGWAANLPTWRIEQHWLLTLFWGGRAMTGYHAWVFTFIGLIFHLPIFLIGKWSWRIEARVVASVMLFWVIEDFLWFVLNPAFGLARFDPINVTWHRHWWGGAPIDYWFAIAIGMVMLAYSFSDKTEKPGFEEAV